MYAAFLMDANLDMHEVYTISDDLSFLLTFAQSQSYQK